MDNKVIEQSVLKDFKIALEQRFGVIDEKEIKELEKETIDSILRHFSQILSICYGEEEVYQFTELHELKLCVKFLTSMYFDKRYKGINEIKNIIDKINITETLKKIPVNHQN